MNQPHIQLSNLVNCKKAIIVGDPARVDKIAECLDDYEYLSYNREYKSAIGKYGGENILAISTGIGAPSTCIAIEELVKIGIKEIIRVGSCGAMQHKIGIGDLIIPIAAVRDEGTSKKYIPEIYPAIPDEELLMIAQKMSFKAIYGIIRSHDGFYMDNNKEIEDFWSKRGIIADDMETSILFVLGKIRKIKTLSILNNIVLYQGNLSSGINDLSNGEEKMVKGEMKAIKLALDVLVRRG